MNNRRTELSKSILRFPIGETWEFRLGHGCLCLTVVLLIAFLANDSAYGQIGARLGKRSLETGIEANAFFDGAGSVAGSNASRHHRVTRLEKQVQQELTHVIRPGDEVWIINTRSAQHCQWEDLCAATQVFQKIGSQFLPDDIDQLLLRINEDTIRENVVFIHGNRTDYHWARLRGTQTYEAILQVDRNQVCPAEGDGCPVECVTECELPPVRWIIWSWPTDIIHGPRRDLDIKRQRAQSEGRLLAMFMQRIEKDEIGVLAYSLGAQALVSALCSWQVQPTIGCDEANLAPGSLSETMPADSHLLDSAPVELLEAEHTVTEMLQVSTGVETGMETDLETDAVVVEDVAVSAIDQDQPEEEWGSETVIDVQESHAMMESVLQTANSGAGDNTVVSGGCLSGECAGPKLRIVMVAAAVPADWFRSQMGRDCMLRCTASLTLINNPRDRVLAVYRKLTHLGPLGTQASFSDAVFPAIVHLVRNNALNNHVLTEYFSSEQTKQQIRNTLFPVR